MQGNLKEKAVKPQGQRLTRLRRRVVGGQLGDGVDGECVWCALGRKLALRLAWRASLGTGHAQKLGPSTCNTKL